MNNQIENTQIQEENIERKLRKCRGCKEYKMIIVGKHKCDYCIAFKTCAGECGETKSISEFYKRNALCIICFNKKQRENYYEDPEEYQKRAKKYRDKTKEPDFIPKKNRPKKEKIKLTEPRIPHNKNPSYLKEDGLEYKKCSKCGEEKLYIEENFYVNTNNNSRCIVCKNEDAKEYRNQNIENAREKDRTRYQNEKEKRKKNGKKYYEENKNEILVKNKIYRENNKEKYQITQKKYYQEHKEEISIRVSIYYDNNREKIIKKTVDYSRERRKIDPIYKLRKDISKSIYDGLIGRCASKEGESSWAYLDYTPQILREHLESLFSHPDNLNPLDGSVWMTLENRGKYLKNVWDDNNPSTWTWQIDHIIPQSDFNFTSMKDEEFKKCWALSNLRPYSAKKNLDEGVKRTRHKKNKE